MASENYYRAVSRAFSYVPRDYEPKPLLTRLHRDAWSTWNGLNYLDEHLLKLLNLMSYEKVDVSPEDDLQLRLAYGIKEAA